MITRQIRFFDQPAMLACDARCNKAWGLNNRPSVQLSEDPDDTMWLGDDDLGEAPLDPGTYEGADGKPLTDDARLNKWCARECERSTIAGPGKTVALGDFSRRWKNMPSSAEAAS